MKHIFYVHSYVTYLVVLGVVEHERISDDDVFLITARGAVNQTRFASMDINEKYPSLFGVPCYGKNLFYIKHYRSIKAFDKEIRDICCNYTYICYIPSDSHFFNNCCLLILNVLKLIFSKKVCSRIMMNSGKKMAI